jgi:hypothetical protein
MSGFDWKAMIRTAAPMLGTALGGPLGGAAGTLIAKALGGDETKTTTADLAKLCQNVTPEQLLALKNADQEFAIKLKAMDINEVKDLEALAVQDRASAREREMKSGDSWTPRILAGVIVFGFLWSVWFVLSGRVQGLKDPTTVGMVGTLIGYVSAKADQVVSYFFGSSSGSRDKDVLLYNSTPIDGGK